MNTIVTLIALISGMAAGFGWIESKIETQAEALRVEFTKVHEGMDNQANFHFYELSLKINESILTNYDALPELTPEQQRDYDLIKAEMERLTERREGLLLGAGIR